jgi:ABC-type nickel/cobalt efflux system permease component RcnA
MTQGLIIGLGGAFVMGLLHSLEPSHAKAVLATYFLNRKRTLLEALAFALTVTFAHTLSIFILAIVGYTVFPLLIRNERMEIWAEVIGGLAMVGIGIWMLRTEWKDGFHKDAGENGEHNHCHGHFFHHHEYQHEHLSPSTFREIFLLGFCSGVIPCMSGLAILGLAWSTGSLASGILLVSSFSLGLGVVVLFFCIAMQQMARVIDRYWKSSARWNRYLPIVSSVLIMGMGAFVMVHSLGELFEK